MPSNSSARCVTWAYCTVSAALRAMASSVSVEVSPRRFSPANTSISRMAQIAVTRQISGTAGARLDQVIVLSVMARLQTSYFGGDRLAHQVMDRRLHDLQERRRPHSHEQYREGERTEHEELARVEVLKRGHPRARHRTENHAFDQPQGVGGAEHQRHGGQERIPEARPETGNDHQELPDEPRGSG